jgi:hypothetical protein
MSIILYLKYLYYMHTFYIFFFFMVSGQIVTFNVYIYIYTHLKKIKH